MLGLTLLVAWPVSYIWGVVGKGHTETFDRVPHHSLDRDVDASVSRWLDVRLGAGMVTVEYSIDTYISPRFIALRAARGPRPDKVWYELIPNPTPPTQWWSFEYERRVVHPERETSEIILASPLPFLAALLLSPALLWLALAWRRRRRTQYRLASGLCLHCGYSLHGLRGGDSAACPECGASRPMVTYREEAGASGVSRQL